MQFNKTPMSAVSRRLWCAPKLLPTIVLILGVPELASCSPSGGGAKSEFASNPTATQDLKQSRANFASAAERLSRGARPITDPAALASRLRIDPARARLLTDTGAVSTRPGTAIAARYTCGGGECTCYGDDECNDMFSGICRSPSTGGKCETWGSDMVVCTCKVATDDDTPTPTEPR